MNTVYDLLSAAARGLAGVDHRLLHRVLDRGEESVPELVRFALEDLSDYPVDLEPDLLNIFRALRTPQAIPFCHKLFRTRRTDVADELTLAYQGLGAASLVPLVELYRELGEQAGFEIPFLLASLGVKDPRINEILIRHLEVDPWDAAVCIQMIDDPGLKPAVERKLAELPGNSDDARELRSALNSIGGPNAPEPPEPYDIWHEYPEKADPAFEVLEIDDLLTFLRHDSADYRIKAAEAFLNEDLTPPLVATLAECARLDADASVRGACWQALGGALDNAEVRGALQQKVVDQAAPDVERCGALIGLAEDQQSLGLVLEWAPRFYEMPSVRAKAMRAMWRTFDLRFGNYFTRHLNDPDHPVRREAIWGVGWLGIGSEAGRLEKMFDDEEFREHALFAYSLSAPAEISRGRIRGLYGKIESAAGGLTSVESEVVESALDHRLAMHDLAPVFSAEHGREHVSEEPPPSEQKGKVGRNEPCPCGSGKKYKKCCGQ